MEERQLDALDERQKRIRWKVGFQSNILLMLLVLANGMVSQYHPWAEPAAGALVIIFLSTSYFVGVTIWREAYQVENRKTARWMKVYLVLGLINLGTVAAAGWRGSWHPVENGLLTTDLTPLVLGVFFLFLSLMWWIRTAHSRRLEREEPDSTD